MSDLGDMMTFATVIFLLVAAAIGIFALIAVFGLGMLAGRF